MNGDAIIDRLLDTVDKLKSKLAESERYIDEITKVANKIYDLDGCCHWETVIENMEKEHKLVLNLHEHIKRYSYEPWYG